MDRKKIVVKFYRPECPHCQAMSEEFQTASEQFSELPFGGINCDAHRRTCQELGVEEYPSIKLYFDDNKPSIKYSGDYSIDSITDFAEKYSGIKASRFSSSLHNLNSLTIEAFKTSAPCSFILFYTPWEKINKRFLNSLRDAAPLFIGDSNVTFGSLSCARYKEACNQNDIGMLPKAYLYINGTKHFFTGSEMMQGIMDFINEKCHTQRWIDGLIANNVNLVDGAYSIAQDYRNAKTNEEKQILKEKMKKLKGTEFYLKIMDRIDKEGIGFIEKSLKNMRTFMDERKGSMQTIDSMKKRFNVITEFEYLPPINEIRELPSSYEKTRLILKYHDKHPEKDYSSPNQNQNNQNTLNSQHNSQKEIENDDFFQEDDINEIEL